jgi:hypothetical protein
MIMSRIYETKDGKFYQKTNKYTIIIVVLSVFLFLSGALSIKSAVQSNSLRTTNSRLTEQLDRATDTCTVLRGTIEECQSICRDIDELSTRSISTARDAIEIIEETREAVGAMEVALGYWDSDSIYERTDDWLESEGVKVYGKE